MSDSFKVPQDLHVVLASRYRIERELGRGGMATVYLAEDLRHERHVAVKVLRAELAAAIGPERFLREIKLTARLDHPHILPLLDSGEAGDLLFYVMPYVEGESLRDRLTREKQLPIDDAVRITREVADALEYAHRHDVVHRDVKPENILLAAGHARVADLGIARAVSAAGGDRLTETGVAVGTPAYMSPEQVAGGRNLDGRSDVYSLACVLYEMLAGEPPFTGATVESVLHQHLTAEPPSITVIRSAVPAQVAATLQQALAKTPADRFATGAQFAEALTEPRGMPIAEPRPIVLRDRLLRQHVRWGISAAVLGGVLLLMGLNVGGVRARLFAPGGPSITSIAVLPLQNLMADSAQDYFVEGMHEALTAELSKISALKVISRTSTMRYKNTEKSMPQIARELQVEGLIEGSVAREGDQVRITVQLIHGPSDRHLWADSYQRELRGILALQSEAAREIARAIRITVTPAEAVRLTSARPVNPEAYDEYLKGLYYTSQFANTQLEPPLRTGVDHFERAITIDSGLALAHAGASYSYSVLAIHYRRTEFIPQARAAALKALALNNGLAEAHAASALVKSKFDWDWEGADQGFRRAVELNPGGSWVRFFYAYFLLDAGRYEEALGEFKRSEEVDPFTLATKTNIAYAHYCMRQYDAAIAQQRRTLALSPTSAWLHRYLGVFYVGKGMYQEASVEFDSASELSGGNPEYKKDRAWLHAMSGERQEALTIVREFSPPSSPAPWSTVALAAVYSALGDKERAFAWLERAFLERDPRLPSIQCDLAFDNLRDDPRFDGALRRMNLRE